LPKWSDVHEPGDVIQGTLVRAEWLDGKSGRWLACNLVDAEGTEWQIPSGRYALQASLEAQDVAIGDYIYVQYRGTYPTSRGGRGHDYSSIVTKPDNVA
jgi:hypothetical protein